MKLHCQTSDKERRTTAHPFCNVIKKEQGMEKQLFDKNFIVINTKSCYTKNR